MNTLDCIELEYVKETIRNRVKELRALQEKGVYGMDDGTNEELRVLSNIPLKELISKDDEVKPTFTPQELFDVGTACGNFASGDIDAGIHMILPVHDTDPPHKKSNEVFRPLFDKVIDELSTSADGMDYIRAVYQYLHENGVEGFDAPTF